MLSGAVAVQALISASSFVVGLLLVRRTTQVEYGYYVLITTAVLLGTTLQGSFIQPPMVVKLTQSTRLQQADFIGGLLKDQRRILLYLSALILVAIAVVGLIDRNAWHWLVVLLFGAIAIVASLHRNFFRMVLFAYRLPTEVLRSDFLYCALLIAGTFLAALTPMPGAAAALALGLSAFAGGFMLSRALWRREPWTPNVATGSLKEIAADGSWSAFGGGVHWLFSQGYTYLVAATINVGTVAALSATKLFTAPVALLSVGIGTLMLPTTSKWNAHHKPLAVLGRLTLFSIGLDALAAAYFLVVWLARGWIFDHVLKRHFLQGEKLLLLWFAVALVTVFRDQLLFFLTTRSRFKATSTLTLVSAILSLTLSFVMMRYVGVIGASLGLLVGESFNTVGILVLSVLEAKRSAGGQLRAAT